MKKNMRCDDEFLSVLSLAALSFHSITFQKLKRIRYISYTELLIQNVLFGRIHSSYYFLSRVVLVLILEYNACILVTFSCFKLLKTATASMITSSFLSNTSYTICKKSTGNFIDLPKFLQVNCRILSNTRVKTKIIIITLWL